MKPDQSFYGTAALSRSSLIADRFLCGTFSAQTQNARVFHGQDSHSGLPKILKQLLNPTPKRIAAFRREGSLLKLQHHSGLIRGDGYFESRGDHWLVMEPAKGRLFIELLQSGDTLHWNESLRRRVVTHLLEAVHNLHQQGWAHGDIKPDNIFVDTSNGTVQLIDYSSTRLTGEEYCCSGYTPDWQHPHLCSGKITTQVDCYALSLLVWSLWTGTHPFARYQAVNFNRPPSFWPFPSKLWIYGFWLRRRLKTATPPSLHQIDRYFGIGRLPTDQVRPDK